MDLNTTDIWHQGSKNSRMLGLVDDFVIVWDNYTEELKRGHIRTAKKEDEIASSINKKRGLYIPKWDLLCTL